MDYHDHHMDLPSAIKARALEVGFDLVGFAPATPGHDLEFARQWLERGYGGEMSYLANPKRFESRSILTSIKSVICVGLIYDTSFPYSTEAQSEAASNRESEARRQKPGDNRQTRVSNFEFRISPPTEPRAWVSRYAWGRDYHEIMREKLEKLRAAIEALAPGTETRVFVDTGPVIERAFARFSGVGWMGKNTCIINEEKGSWFFLGVILTNLALEPDLPAPDRCGSCRACLDACPTGALVEPYVMDASRCISYLTIELKGSIPVPLRPGMGANIFGCDICQDVCPWNRRSQESGVRSRERSFQPSAVSSQLLAISSQPSGKDEGQPSQQSTVSSRQSAKDELRSTNDETPERQLPTFGNMVSSGGQGSSIQNPISQIQDLPETRHPAPDTFSLFSPSLEALAAMTETDFRRAFAHSPIKRAKYRGWLRNLSVAMGNSGDPRVVPKLKELSQHPDPIVREHAEWALDQIARGS